MLYFFKYVHLNVEHLNQVNNIKLHYKTTAIIWRFGFEIYLIYFILRVMQSANSINKNKLYFNTVQINKVCAFCLYFSMG